MKFVLLGDPIPWKRPAGRYHRYDSQKKEKERVRASLLTQWNNAFESENKEIQMEASKLAHAEAFELTFTFVLGVNKNEMAPHQNAKLWGFKLANEKPDLDNVIKFLMDVGNGFLWADDKQIVTISEINKHYGEVPKTIMEVKEKIPIQCQPLYKDILCCFSPKLLDDFYHHILHLAKSLQYFDHTNNTSANLPPDLLTKCAKEIEFFVAMYFPIFKAINRVIAKHG